MIKGSKINTDDGWYRQYGVVKLSKKQLCKEIEVYRDFQKYVGTHWDEKFINEPPQFIRDSSKLFYEKYNVYIDTNSFENNLLIGWIEI